MTYLVSVKVPAYPAHDRGIYASDIRRLFADHMPDATVLGIDCEDHSGWPNRETWQANLWVSNDEGLYDRVTQYAHRTRHPLDGDAVRELVEDHLYATSGYESVSHGLAGDIIGLWLQRVDWDAIAQAFSE